MGASFRPSLDDLYKQSYGPRADRAPAPKRSLDDLYNDEETAPAPATPPTERPGVLSRTLDAAKGLGRAVASDPVGTAKGIGKGILDQGVDLAALATRPNETFTRFLVEEGGDIKAAGIRAANASSLLLPVAGRAAGLGVKGISALDYAASAGLGAAQTPEDRGVGALLGLGMNAIADVPRAVGGARSFAKNMKALTGGDVAPPLVPRPPQPSRLIDAPNRTVAGLEGIEKMIGRKTLRPDNVDGPRRSPATPDEAVVNAAKAAGDLEPEVTPRRALGYSEDGTYSAGGLDADGLPETPFVGNTPRADRTPALPVDRMANKLVPAKVAAALEYEPTPLKPVEPNPNPARIADEAFPEGYTTGTLSDDITRELDALDRQRVSDVFTPEQRQSLPPTSKRYPRGYQAEPPIEPVKRGLPEKPTSELPLAPVATSGDAFAPVPTTGAVRRTPQTAPVAQAVDAPPASTVVETPGVPTAAPDAPVGAPRASEAVSDAIPDAPAIPPAKESYLNWRTIADRDAPLGQQTLDRIQARAKTMEPELAAARGRVSYDAQRDMALKQKRIREIFDDPLSVDKKKLQRLTGAEIGAVKEVLGENERMVEVISREMASGDLGPEDMALAARRLEQLENSNREALLTIQSEGSARGRDLGYLKNVARLTTDPDAWMVRAQKILGDTPMTDDVMTKVRALAIAAGNACG
jgi:hypothetical protein